LIGIRRATVADADAIARVHIASWRETYIGLVPDEIVATSTRWENRSRLWHERFAHHGRSVFVVDRDGAIAGFACAAPTGLEPARPPLIEGYDAYLEALYLLRDVHGNGRGREIMSVLVGDLRARGMRNLSLHVLATNPSRAFYEKFGAVWVRDEPAGPHSGTYQCAYAWPDLEQLAARLA
jgi:GNAT superfamily N-acetyltransferase